MNGMPLGVFPPASPPTFPTPENVFDGIVKTSSDYVMTAPAMVEVICATAQMQSSYSCDT